MSNDNYDNTNYPINPSDFLTPEQCDYLDRLIAERIDIMDRHSARMTSTGKLLMPVDQMEDFGAAMDDNIEKLIALAAQMK